MLLTCITCDQSRSDGATAVRDKAKLALNAILQNIQVCRVAARLNNSPCEEVVKFFYFMLFWWSACAEDIAKGDEGITKRLTILYKLKKWRQITSWKVWTTALKLLDCPWFGLVEDAFFALIIMWSTPIRIQPDNRKTHQREVLRELTTPEMTWKNDRR